MSLTAEKAGTSICALIEEGHVNALTDFGLAPKPLTEVRADARGTARPIWIAFHSKPFRHGFCEGFGAPTLVLRRFEYPRAESIDTSLSGAWKAVGKALKEATVTEGGRIGKATRKGVTAG